MQIIYEYVVGFCVKYFMTFFTWLYDVNNTDRSFDLDI